MRIRTMTEQDAVAIAALSGQLGYPAAAEQLAARFRELAGDSDTAVLVAEAPDRAVAGWIHVCGRRSLENDPHAEAQHWAEETSRPFQLDEVSGTFDQLLGLLAPLTAPLARRQLFVTAGVDAPRHHRVARFDAQHRLVRADRDVEMGRLEPVRRHGRLPSASGYRRRRDDTGDGC